MKTFAAAAIALAVSLYAAAGYCGELSTSQSAEVKASSEQVWALLIAVNNWAQWNPAVKKASLTEGDGEQAGSVVEFNPVIGDKNGPKVKLTLVKSDKPGLYEFTSKAPGMNIVFGLSMAEKDGVTTVTSYETISGPGSGAFKSMYGQEGLDREHRVWVESIKKKIESTDDKGSGGK